MTDDVRKRADDLVAAYLDHVRRAGAGLAPERLDELLADLTEHIAAARSELEPETEASVRTLLDRLGDPAAIVAEATVGEHAVPAATPAPAPPAPAPPAAAPAGEAARRSNRTLTIVLVTIAAILLVPLLLCVIGLVMFQSAGVEVEHGPIDQAPVSTWSPSSSPAG